MKYELYTDGQGNNVLIVNNELKEITKYRDRIFDIINSLEEIGEDIATESAPLEVFEEIVEEARTDAGNLAALFQYDDKS